MTQARRHAAPAVLRWLHGRPIGRLDLRVPDDAPLPAEPDPKSEADIRERIRAHLAGPAAAMIHDGGTPETHIDLADPHVERAALLACRLPGDDPIRHLEDELDATLSTLRSPRIWFAVSRLAKALSDHRTVHGKTAAALIAQAFNSGNHARIEPHHRRIYVRAGGEPAANPGARRGSSAGGGQNSRPKSSPR